MSNFRLVTCRDCGAVMVQLTRDICAKCIQKEEEFFNEIREYLRDNPGATVYQVAEALKQDLSKVEEIASSGRLERCGVSLLHECQTCGKVIESGIICKDCKQDIKHQVGDLKKKVTAKPEPEPETSDDKKKKGGIKLRTTT